MGALTSKPYAFSKRSWELRSYESINFLDGFAQSISIDIKNNEVFRVLPVVQNVGENWITDRIRFCYDSFKRQRIGYPYLRIWNGFESELVLMSWNYILNTVLLFFNNELLNIYECVAGKFVDLNTQIILKDFSLVLGLINSCKFYFFDFYDFRTNYIVFFNWYKITDLVVLINTEYRSEWPLLNTIIKKCVLNNNLNVLLIGCAFNLGYNSEYFGNSIEYFKFSVEGKAIISNILILSCFVRFFSNVGIFLSKNLNVYNLSKYLSNVLFKFGVTLNNNILGLNVSDFGTNDLGFLFSCDEQINELGLNKLLYLIDNDEIDSIGGLCDYSDYNLVMYQGHHFDCNAYKADLILPSTLVIEKNGIFGNLYGFYKNVKLIITPMLDVRVEWRIVGYIFEYLTKQKFSDNFDFANKFKIYFGVFVLNRFCVLENDWFGYFYFKLVKLKNIIFQNFRVDQNVIVRWSQNMFNMEAVFKGYIWGNNNK